MCLVFCGPSEKCVFSLLGVSWRLTGPFPASHTILKLNYCSTFLCFEAVTLPNRSASFSWITGRQYVLPRLLANPFMSYCSQTSVLLAEVPKCVQHF